MLKSVLLVDDNPFDNQIHRLILVRAGVVASEADVLEARDGVEGVELLREAAAGDAEWFPPALVLVDINMPRMNGFEFVEAATPLLGDRDERSTVVLMLTSSISTADQTRASALDDVDGYIQKPLTQAAAKALAAQHLAKSR